MKMVMGKERMSEIRTLRSIRRWFVLSLTLEKKEPEAYAPGSMHSLPRKLFFRTVDTQKLDFYNNP
jgi:hypothetical protein